MGDKIKEEVRKKISELQYIMSQKGKGGEKENTILTTASANNQVDNIKTNKEGGKTMKPITRNGEEVVDGKITDPAIDMSAGAGAPPTDFLALAKSTDPYTENVNPVVTAKDDGSVPETNTEINKALNKMQSTTEHAEAEKAVEKPVSMKSASDDITNIVARVRQLKKANEEIAEVVKEKPEQSAISPDQKERILANIRAKIQKKSKVDGMPTDPVKGNEDAAKTPEESVKSIKTTKKAEKDDRPVEPVGDGKTRYKPEPDVRDSWAADALSQNKKDEKISDKEPKKERPVTNKKAGLAGKLASLEVFAEDVAERLRSKKVKYPVEKSPDMDFEGAASKTETVINKEHNERKKDTGEKSPLKTTLWKQKGNEKIACIKDEIKKRIKAYTEALKEVKGESKEDMRKLQVLEANINALESQMQKLSYVNLSTKPTSEMSWGDIIAEGNAVYANLLKVLGEVNSIASPFLEQADEAVKTASIRTAEFEAEDKDEKKDDDKDEKKDDDKGDDKDEKKDDKKDSSKKEEKSVAKETIDLLKDINETAEKMSEEIGDHLKLVEKKTGIPVPEPKDDLPGLPGKGDLPPMPGEGAPSPEGLGDIPGLEEIPPMPGEGALPMKMSWIGVVPKTAMEEEQIVEEIKKDTELQPEQKWNEIKKIRKTQSWKAVFTKIGSKDEKTKVATVDKQNSYWSVYRGTELVIRATVADLYKNKAADAFQWASSKGYGEKLLSAVLNDGITVTASKLGIESMIKVGAKSGGESAKAYYRKIYPASYVSELFKEHKKKADAEIAGLKTKLGETEEKCKKSEEENEKLVESQVLHAKAEKALALVRTAVEKGLVKQTDFDSVVDGVMLMNDDGFKTFSSTILKAPSVKKASIDDKIEMVKNASKTGSPSLDVPIQIQSTGASSITQLKEGLNAMWKIPLGKK